MKPAPTLHDIAAATGVSIFTVSRVLNGHVAKHARTSARAERIRTVAAELGYRPNLLARSMRERRSRLIGVFLTRRDLGNSASHPAAFTYLLGIHDALEAADRAMAIAEIHENAPLALREHHLDGAIVINALSGEDEASLRACIPHIVHIDAPLGAAILRDEESAGRLVGEALARAGWSQVLWVRPPERADEHYSLAARERGFFAACAAAGVAVTTRHLNAGEAADEIVTQAAGGAVAVYDAYLVQRLLGACLRLGLAPGRNFALACCDRDQSLSQWYPDLTCAAVDLRGMGRAAGEMLVRRLDGGVGADSAVLYPIVRLRGSTHLRPGHRGEPS